jgi:hypothetical protein
VPATLDEQRAAMLRRMKSLLRLKDDQLSALSAILAKSPIIGQGNPEIVEYAMTRKECRERRDAAGVVEEEAAVCGGPFMSPLYDPKAGQTSSDAKVCIDRYEFPGIPCDYPVTWASAGVQGLRRQPVRRPAARIASPPSRSTSTRPRTPSAVASWSRGRSRPSQAVRAEEFLNAFDYRYEAPKTGAFAVHLAAAPSPFTKGTTSCAWASRPSGLAASASPSTSSTSSTPAVRCRQKTSSAS